MPDFDTFPPQNAAPSLRDAADALHQQSEMMQAVVDTAAVLIVVLDTQGRTVHFNRACEEVTGCLSADVCGEAFPTRLLLPEEQEDVVAVFERLRDGQFPSTYENHWVATDGTPHLIAWTNTALKNAGGGVEFVIATGIEVGPQRQMEAALRHAEEQYRSIFENALDGIFQTTPDGQYRAANPALAHIYGYGSPQELMHGLTDIAGQLYVDPADRGRFADLLTESDSVSGFEAAIRRRDGSVIWIAEHARAVRDKDGALLYYEGTVQDITERKTLEAERERLLRQSEQLLQEATERADRDPLTGLLNHRAFHHRLEEETARAERTGEPLTVAVMDLDNFKFFNDAYGHAAGDDVLRLVADALRAGCRSYDTLARFGGDEFAVLLPATTAGRAAGLMRRLSACVAETGYRPPGYDTLIPLGLTIGSASFPQDGMGRLDVLAEADSRLRRAKSGAGGTDADEAERLRGQFASSVSGFSMLDALVTAVDNKDRYTRRHSEDVCALCLSVGREMRLDRDNLHTLAAAALLHDVGKIGIPDRILRKPGSLTDEEFEAVRQHPMMGAVIVGAVAGLEHTLDCVRHHHERWDGKGYPFGLKGEETPRLARIMAVADAFSAMTTDRPYRKGMREEDALAMLAAGAGTQWDAACVRALGRARKAEADKCFA